VTGFYRDGAALVCDGVPLDAIAAAEGTPLYVYSAATIASRYRAIDEAFAGHPHSIHYALKANSTLAIARLLRGLGSNADANSGGEIEVARRAGFGPSQIVFTGVGKTRAELGHAIDLGVRSINVESEGEIERIEALSRERKVRTKIAVRVNPDVDARTHPYISTGLRGNKFGIAHTEALAAYRRAVELPGLEVVGIDCHIGSQITDSAPYLEALDRLLDLIETLEAEGIAIPHLDLGGGLGIAYDAETPPDAEALMRGLLERIDARGHGGRKILVEPGRSLVGNAGVLVSEVVYVKPGETKNFCIVDAAMNDLARPAMYGAWMRIVECERSGDAPQVYDVVGPICESGDWLGRDRSLAVRPASHIAVLSAGAYAMSMSSNYNTRGRAAEVLVSGSDAWLVRDRESTADQIRGEHLLPER